MDGLTSPKPSDSLEAALAAYDADGVAVLRQAIPLAWRQRLETAVERLLTGEQAGPVSVVHTAEGRPGRFYNDSFVSWRDPEFRAFAHESPLPPLAGEFLRSRRVGFFHEQVFVKEPGTQERMPWHQDLPYWPVREPRVLTMWVPLDPVTRASGAVVYAKGSHRWGRTARRWVMARDGQPPPPPIPALVDYETEEIRDATFIYYNLAPGDLLVHHPLAVHASLGNRTQNIRRRAVAFRYYGEGCTFESRSGHVLLNERVKSALPTLTYADGDRFESSIFPVVWEAPEP